jgi:hypothetical protein
MRAARTVRAEPARFRPLVAAHPAGDEPLESGAGTLRAACPTLGRQERRITGGADDPNRWWSAKGPRLDHHRRRGRRRHHATAFAARAAGRSTGRLMHRSAAGGLAWLRLWGCTGRGTSRTRGAELHERRTAAAVRTTETTAATRGGSEAAEGDHETQGTAHGWHLHHRRAGNAPRSDTMRRPRRRLSNPSSRSATRSDGQLDFSKKFPCRPQPAAPTLPIEHARIECAGCPQPFGPVISIRHRLKTRATVENSR